jgi:hypothetical protein
MADPETGNSGAASAPTPEQAVELGQAVGQAAEGATSADEARQRAEQAARTTSDKHNLELSVEQIKAIGDGVVTALEQRGAFDSPPEPVAPPPAPPEATAAAAAAAEATAPPAPVEAKPQKKTFAQRFLGE